MDYWVPEYRRQPGAAGEVVVLFRNLLHRHLHSLEIARERWEMGVALLHTTIKQAMASAGIRGH